MKDINKSNQEQTKTSKGEIKEKLIYSIENNRKEISKADLDEKTDVITDY